MCRLLNKYFMCWSRKKDRVQEKGRRAVSSSSGMKNHREFLCQMLARIIRHAAKGEALT